MKASNYFSKILVNNKEININELDRNNGKLNYNGNVEVKYILKDNTKLPANIFNSVSTINNIILPSSVTTIEQNAFNNTEIKKIDLSKVISNITYNTNYSYLTYYNNITSSAYINFIQECNNSNVNISYLINTINDNYESINTNFIPNEPIRYKIGLISDVHYNDDDTLDENPDSINAHNNEEDFYYDLINSLNFFNTNNIDFVACSGDITTDHESDFMNYKYCVNKYGNNLPIYTCSGNHDTLPKKINQNGWKEIDHLNNNLLIKRFADEEFIYNDEIIQDLEGTSFYFEKQLSGNKKDIYIFLNVEYGWDDVNNYHTHHCRSLNQNELLVHSEVESNDIHLYNPTTLKCLAALLEKYKNNRCFIFTHLMFKDYAGSYHGDEGYYDYYNNHADVLKGDQGEFLDNLVKQYSNNYWFSGHSHYKWAWENYDNTMNVVKVNNSYTIHLPSLSRPLPVEISSYRAEPNASEGAIMEVYDSYVIIKGIIFKDENNENYTNEYLPIANYKLY